MAPVPIFRFALPTNDIITYNFDPDMRDEDGEGVVTLERISRPAEPQDATTPMYPEPKPGHEFYSYTAEDGGEVRYQYDPGSRNGKDYVVAIHREPGNWMRLRAENLAVKGSRKKRTEEKKERTRQRQAETGPESATTKEDAAGKARRDSGVRVD